MLCFCQDDDENDHGVHLANTAQALARWRHLGASHEATEMLHWEMCLASYQLGSMVVGFVVNRVTFYFFVDNRVANI